MNAKQASTIEYMKRNYDFVSKDYVIDGELTFKTEDIGNSVYVWVSNVDSIKNWFDRLYMAAWLIGPRGGITRKAVN